MIKTVGDLKRALQIFDDNLSIDIEGYKAGTEDNNIGYLITEVDGWMQAELGVRGVSIYARRKEVSNGPSSAS